MNKKFFIITPALVIILVIIFIFVYDATIPNQTIISPNQTSVSSQSSTNINLNLDTASSSQAVFIEPISQALSRVTKKPFGIYVTPQNSPVSPEKFTGYHTGVDFETLPDEASTDVPIYAICNGSLALKKYATSYGGVAVESCKLNGQDITIIYGHLKLASITINIGSKLIAGQPIGILGKGYSTETDGERKHLHLGIHKGSTLNLLGYVQNASELANWLDVTKYLK